jgi:hypothetical protein
MQESWVESKNFSWREAVCIIHAVWENVYEFYVFALIEDDLGFMKVDFYVCFSRKQMWRM